MIRPATISSLSTWRLFRIPKQFKGISLLKVHDALDLFCRSSTINIDVRPMCCEGDARSSHTWAHLILTASRNRVKLLGNIDILMMVDPVGIHSE